MNTREKVLKEALNCVNGEREKQYGNPEDNFRRIADLWSVYLTSLFEDEKIVVDIDPIDVAKMMILFKIARSNGDQDKMDNYVDMIGYAACGAEIFERSEEDSKKVKEWTEKMKGFGGNGDGKEASEAVNELKREGKKFAEKIFRPGLTTNNDLNNIELADECKDCNYAKKCMGTGVCLKEFDSAMADWQVRHKKDKPDDKCNRKDCGWFDACMTAYQHYIYNKTKEANEAIDECMCEQVNKNETKINSFWNTYNSISACITLASLAANVDQFDVVSRLTKNGHAPTEMASLLLVGRLNSDTVASYVENAINELKKENSIYQANEIMYEMSRVMETAKHLKGYKYDSMSLNDDELTMVWKKLKEDKK